MSMTPHKDNWSCEVVQARMEALEFERDKLKEEVARLIGCWTEIDRLKRELDRAKDYIYGEREPVWKERDVWKSRAEKLAEAIKFPLSYLEASDPDEEDGIHAVHLLKEALSDYEKEIGE